MVILWQGWAVPSRVPHWVLTFVGALNDGAWQSQIGVERKFRIGNIAS